jgi:mRNA interferase RelE/StbE
MYKIIFDNSAADFFRKLDNTEKKRIGKKIESLKENPHAGIPLTGNLAGLWKLRIGDYRAVYQVKNNELIILILKLGHRKNVYN